MDPIRASGPDVGELIKDVTNNRRKNL